MPLIACQPVELVVGVNAQAHVGEIGTSDRDRSGPANTFHDRCIGGTHRVGEGRNGVGGGCAGEIDVLFHGAGHSVQRAEWCAGTSQLVGAVGGGECFVVESTHDGVEARVHVVDPRQVGFDHLTTRHLTRSDQCGQFTSGSGPESIGHVAPFHETSGEYPDHVNRWIVGSRPRTLPAAVVPVALGAVVAVGEGGAAWERVPLAGIVALALQVGVNYANDYSDGVRGVDDDRVGPVRLVGSGLTSARAVKMAAFTSFGIAALVGLVLAASTSWWLLVVGAASILAGWFYTGGPRPYGYAGFGELFVFVFFGLVATVGTTYVVLERLPATTWWLGTATGALSCALLVTNNLRDVPTDRVAGKNTLAVRMGVDRTRHFFTALIVVSFASLAVAGAIRPEGLFGLLAAPVAVGPVRAVRSGASGRELVPVLASTGRLQLVMGILVVLATVVVG